MLSIIKVLILAKLKVLTLVNKFFMFLQKENIKLVVTLMPSILTAFYMGQQVTMMARQQQPDLYIQAFYGDNRFIWSAENQNKIPEWDTIQSVEKKQLVVVVSNTGGVPATITRVKTGTAERSIVINGRVKNLTINPYEAKYFNVVEESPLTNDVSNITLYGFNRDKEIWSIQKKNIHIQSNENPYQEI